MAVIEVLCHKNKFPHTLWAGWIIPCGLLQLLSNYVAIASWSVGEGVLVLCGLCLVSPDIAGVAFMLDLTLLGGSDIVGLGGREVSKPNGMYSCCLIWWCWGGVSYEGEGRGWSELWREGEGLTIILTVVHFLLQWCRRCQTPLSCTSRKDPITSHLIHHSSTHTI